MEVGNITISVTSIKLLRKHEHKLLLMGHISFFIVYFFGLFCMPFKVVYKAVQETVAV